MGRYLTEIDGLILHLRQPGSLGGLARFPERRDPLGGEQRDHPEEDLARHDGVAERRVAADHRDTEAIRDLLEAAPFEVGVEDLTQQEDRKSTRLNSSH